MGQYYTPVLTQGKTTICFNNRTALMTEQDKIEQAKSSYYNYHGLKIMEHSWLRNDLVNGVAKRLLNKKGRVVWVGDYSDEGIFKSTDGTETPLTLEELYNASRKSGEDENGYNIYEGGLPDNVKFMKLVRYNPNFTMEHKFLINLTKKEYVHLDEYISRSISEDGWCVHPLPLLTSTGGDNGGGDYHECFIDSHLVGHWAYDELIIKEVEPKGFTKLDVTFSEEMENTLKAVGE